MSDRPYRSIMSERAAAELEEAIAYIHRDSPRNAVRVVDDILKTVDRLRRYPKSSEVDPAAPKGLGAVEARRAVASGFVIRYAFPVRWADDAEVVYIVSIQRASRLPLDHTGYMLRFIQEAAATYSRHVRTAAGVFERKPS